MPVQMFQKLKKYFDKDYSYKAILHLLSKRYNIDISLRTLSRLLKSVSLRRKNMNESPIEEIVLAIMIELEGFAYNFGYRAMWKHIRKVYGLTVKQKTVMKLLKLIDPVGVELRSRYKLKRRQYYVPGPNFLWHVDGHDKLKRFGFAIYGCIDGFSRKLIWVDVGSTNNDPKIIGYQYLKAIEKFEFLPTLIRADKGTEATIMENMQIALRYNHEDEFAGQNSFHRGKSPSNQRIESYWRQFRQHLCDFYIGLFKRMEYDNLIDINNPVQIECLRYCFGHLIKEEVALTRKEWNEHRIRKQNARDILGGIPNELFHMPQKFDAIDHKKEVCKDDIQILLNAEFTTEPTLYSREIKNLVNLLGFNKTCSTAEEAFNMYFEITSIIKAQIEVLNILS